MRIRTVKPEFFTHDGLFEAERAEGLPLRVAFAGLWCAADREGRFKWEPRRLGVAILPYDGIDFSRVLDALATRAFIVKYRVGDAWFGAIPSFNRHQVVNNRESASQIPSVKDADEVVPSEISRVGHASGTRGARDTHACKGEGKGKERKEGKELSADSATPNVAGLFPESEPAPPLPEPEPPKPPKERNPLFDALAAIDGANPAELTKPAARACGVALAEIRKATPDVTPEEITRRAANYRAHFPTVACTPSALSKHWATMANQPRIPDEKHQRNSRSFEQRNDYSELGV